jgi:hypothetical protein
MNKIRRVSFFFRMFFIALFPLVPLIEVLGWMKAPQPMTLLLWRLDVIPASYQAQVATVLAMHTKVLALMVSLLPAAMILLVLSFLIKLFKLYERGEIFSSSNVRIIRNIGYTLLASQFVYPVYEAALGIVLTWHNLPGHRMFMVSFGQNNVGMLLVALLVILISWIMAEGCKLREEQQLTI